MAEKVEAFLVAYSSQARANSAPEFRNCALGGLSEERFEFAENLLDRTHSLDRVRHTGYLMSRKVVHDDDVTVVERWSQTLFDVCEEDRPVHRPIDHERCDHPVVAQSDNQGDGLPMAVGNLVRGPSSLRGCDPRVVGVFGVADLAYLGTVAR